MYHALGIFFITQKVLEVSFSFFLTFNKIELGVFFQKIKVIGLTQAFLRPFLSLDLKSVGFLVKKIHVSFYGGFYYMTSKIKNSEWLFQANFCNTYLPGKMLFLPQWPTRPEMPKTAANRAHLNFKKCFINFHCLNFHFLLLISSAIFLILNKKKN